MGFVDVSPPTAGLISSLAASSMYGLNIVAFFTCMYVLLRRRVGGNGVPWFIFCAAVIQFIVSTIHIGNCWRQMLEAFIWGARSPGASFAYFVEEPAKSTEVINKALVFVESFLTDSILVWRAYIVWGRNTYICVAPFVTMISYTITSGIGLGKLGQLPQIGRDAFVVYHWFVLSLGLTLTTHVLLTSLIVGKIWKGARNSTVYIGTTRHMAVVWMVVESGAVYSVAVTLLVIFAALETQVASIIAHVFVQLCELVPTLIIVRVGLGLTSDLTTYNHDTVPTTIRFHHTLDLGAHQTAILEEENSRPRGTTEKAIQDQIK